MMRPQASLGQATDGSSGEGARWRPEKRIQRALTASPERRMLVWMAERAPGWLTSDQLTALGLAAQIGAGASFAASHHHPRILLFTVGFIVLNWLGDSLDGTLARVRQQQRPRYGFYVDHIVDLFGAIVLMGGLACSGWLHAGTAVAMLVAFLLLAGESFLATHSLGHFEISQGLFGPTEIRLLLIVGCLRLLHSPYATVLHHRVLLLDFGGAIAAAAMFVMAIVVTLRHTGQLRREEPLP